MEILGCGKVAKGTVDVYPAVEEAKSVDVRVDRVNSVLGIDLSREEMVSMLEALEMKVEGEGNIMTVTPPTVRQDLLEEVDYIEEVARMYGYDKMPVTLPKSNTEATKPETWVLKDLARDTLCAMGLDEIQTYSFVSPKGVDNIRLGEETWERNFVRILNPLGEENSVMRTVLTPNMLEVLGRNYSRKLESAKAFEIGNTFFGSINDPMGLPEEHDALCIGLYGDGADFFTLKGIIVELLKIMGINDIEFIPEENCGAYHPGRCARIMVNILDYDTTDPEALAPVELGIMGEVHPDVAEKYGINTRTYCCELRFNIMADIANVEKAFKPLPKYPAATRDIAVVVDDDIPVGQMVSIITFAGGELLEDVKLFDIYRGEQAGEGKKSVAFTLTYRDPEKTLTDEEVTEVHDKIVDALTTGVEAVLREM